MVEKARAATAVVQSRPWAPTAVVFPGVVNAGKSGYDYSQELPRVNLYEEGLSNNDKKPPSLTNQHSVVLYVIKVQKPDPNRTLLDCT